MSDYRMRNYNGIPVDIPVDIPNNSSNVPRFPMTPISPGQQSPEQQSPEQQSQDIYSYFGFGSNPQQQVTPIVSNMQKLINSGVERLQAQKASDFINKYLRLQTGIQNLRTSLTPPEISDLTIEIIKDDIRPVSSRRYSMYGGKRRHRTRGRHQRGGYSMSTFSNDAAPITGGRRRRRRTYKKNL